VRRSFSVEAKISETEAKIIFAQKLHSKAADFRCEIKSKQSKTKQKAKANEAK
jgi:hypothetical protein